MAKRKRACRRSLTPSPSPSPCPQLTDDNDDEVSVMTNASEGGRGGDHSAPAATSYRRAYGGAPQLGAHIFFLFVGETHQLLTVHSDLLAGSTKTYLNTRFYEGQVCWLPEVDPSIADLWRLYLYTGNVFSQDEAIDQDTADTGDESHADGEWSKLAQAYLLGRKIQDDGFLDACVSALIAKVQDTGRFPTGIAGEVYMGTAPGDKLRKLIVDLHVYMGECECLREPHEDARGPKAFLRDVQREKRRASDILRRPRVQPWESDPCMYHVHGEMTWCRQ